MTNPLRLLQLVKLLDVTRLTEADNSADIENWLQGLPVLPVAAYCVYPEYLSHVQQYIRRHHLNSKLATVVNFPDGNQASDQVCEHIQQCILSGADEIDCVLPYQALLAGEDGLIKNFLYDVRQVSADKCLKIIIESGELITAQQVAKATELAIEGGADFVKSSTGKVAVGITEEAARIMLTVIAASGKPVGFKASGGVRTVSQALTLMSLYEEICGETAVNTRMRIGASTLLTELYQTLEAPQR